MTLSMTGFGCEAEIFENKKFSLEIRSLNSKSLDITTKLPTQYKDKELEIRTLIAQKLIRGKIEFTFIIENMDKTENVPINENLLISYYKKIENICKQLNISTPDNIINSIMLLPDVNTLISEKYSDSEWSFVSQLIDNVLNKCILFRQQEGEILEKDILLNNNNILNLLTQILPYESERFTTIQQRLSQNYSKLTTSVNIEKEKFEEELFFYIEKLDINEEKVRLRKHCEYLIETMNDIEYSGRKLIFICQEIGREINTLGAKAHHIEIQKIVVRMKDELEKIKEQLLNVL